jgi:hypothetical protein
MRRLATPSALLLLSSLAAACSAGSEDAPDGGALDPDADPATPRPGEIAPASSVIAPPVTPPGWLPPAPPMVGEIRYLPNRDSALIYLPVVDGVQDYRVYALTPGVTVTLEDRGGVQVDDATIFCAGLRQHNQCDDGEALDYGTNFHVPGCDVDSQTVDVAKEVLRVVQLEGLTSESDVVIEAIDALCPFPGADGARHTDLECVNSGVTVAPAQVGDDIVQWATCPTTFPIRTEAEIRAQYGSMIVNGHGAPPRGPGESPFAEIGLPAPARAPEVLARAVVRLTPLGTSALPPGYAATDFFEDFDDPSDQPELVLDGGEGTLVPEGYGVWGLKLHQTSTLSFYSHSSDDAQFHVARGTLRSVFADAWQEIMGSNVMVPRRAFALPPGDDGYLHVTFEVPTNATQRRYWVFQACGAEELGQTIGSGPGFAADGAVATGSAAIYTPGFMDTDGQPLSTAGWNCLQLVPRNGSYFGIDGGPYPRAETDLRVVINEALPDYDAATEATTRRSVTNVSPDQQGDDPAGQGTWYRRWDAAQQLDAPLLDGEMYIEQRTHLDVFFNRGRVVVYANGEQLLCNDYPAHRLTMAEAAIGVGHVLYHSSAERSGFAREDWLSTAQYQYRKNLPFLDERGFDNLGVRENTTLPADFEEGQCYAGN